MKHILKVGCIFMLIVSLLMPVAWAEERISTIKLNQVQQMKDELTMYVSMSDSLGNPCSGDYTVDQFSISVDGKALDVDSIEKFDSTKQGIHYVFSVDVSKSLTAAMIERVRTTMNEFVDNMGAKDTVSIITFGEKTTERIINSSDKEKIKDAINGIQANENMTALYKGVLDAVAIAYAAGGRSAVIVVTDGKNDPTEEMKIYTKENIFESVKNAQVPLYCIGLNDSKGVDTESLKELADVTGGEQFVIRAEEMSVTMNWVQAVMKSALVLRATLLNTENKAGFDEISTFKVGFQPTNGSFLTSNELHQNINWKSVPVVVVTPSPTPIPQLSLSLDEDQVKYTSSDKKAVITGAIEIKQGFVEENDLVISVNGEMWRITEIMRNGDGYTFRAEGSIPSSTEILEVQAMIRDVNIASRIQRVEVVMPTQVPTATPSPILSVELDDSGRSILFEEGKVIEISGVINVQGTINPDDLALYINAVPYDMEVQQINQSQYEFYAQCIPQFGSVSELSIQIKLNNTDIYSRTQILFLTTPSPTPNPELYFSLNDASVEYVEGQPIIVRGNIEIVSGEVDADDLALYINNIRWDMKIEPLSDGTFKFEAENTLVDGSITQVDVRVRLLSNSRVVSNSEKLAVSTPVPTSTPSPTPRAVVTPPPTAYVVAQSSAVPQPVSTENDSVSEHTDNILQAVIDNGTLWYIMGAVALIVILIVVLVIVLTARKKRHEVVAESSHSTDWSFSHDGNEAAGKTTRVDDPDATIRKGSTDGKDSDFISDDNTEDSQSADSEKNVDKKVSGTMRIDSETESSGTVRLDDDETGSGTQRIEEEIKCVDITMEEVRKNQPKESRALYIECDNELTIGRESIADIVLDDATVSSKHLMITYDGEAVYIMDLGSTNGTKLNRQSITQRERIKIASGDSVLIGKTTLTFRFELTD